MIFLSLFAVSLNNIHTQHYYWLVAQFNITLTRSIVQFSFYLLKLPFTN